MIWKERRKRKKRKSGVEISKCPSAISGDTLEKQSWQSITTIPFNSFYYCCCLRESRRTWRQKVKVILFICYCKQRSEEGIWKLNIQCWLDLESLLLNSSDRHNFSGQITSGPLGVPKRSSSLSVRVLPLEDIYSQFSSFSATNSHHHPHFLSGSLAPAYHSNPLTEPKDPGPPSSLGKRERWMSPGSRKG